MDRAVDTPPSDAQGPRPSGAVSKFAQPVLRYGLTLLLIAATAAIAHALRVDFYIVPILLMAVVICAWYGGGGAGAAAVIAGTFTIYFFFHLLRLEARPGIDDVSHLTQFIVTGALIAYLITARKKAEWLLREARDELEAKVVARTADLRQTNEKLQEEVIERRRAERVALQLEKELRDVIEAIPAIVTRMAADGPTEFISHRWQEFTGLSEEEGLGWKWAGVIHPEDQVTMVADWRVAIEKGEVLETEIRLRRADGQYRWWFVRAVPLFDELGNITKWYGSAIDIDDRKRAEEKLRRAEEQARKVIDTIPQQIWSGPADGTLDFCNYQWRVYTGLEMEEIQGNGWQTVLHPDDKERMLKAWHGAVASGTPYEQEERHRKADGTYRWFLSRALPLRDAEGHVVRWYGSNTDIEDRKRAEEALRLIQAYLAEAQRLTHTGSWAWNTHKNMGIYWSEEMFRIFGLDTQGMPPDFNAAMRLVHPDDRNVVSARIGDAMRERADFVEDCRLLLPDGTLKYLHVIGHPVLDQSREVIEYIGTAVDVTERRRAEMDLAQLNAELEQRVVERTAALEAANQELEAFSYSVSHDLRAPLRAVNGFAAIFADDYGRQLPEAGRDLVSKIQEQARKMSLLIEDLLSFSRTARQPLEGSPVDLVTLAHECFRELGAQCEGREIDFKVGALPEATGDRALLYQVMLNLLGNAVKYTRGRSPARIEVGTEEREGETVYFVRDNGVGFDMRYVDRLFGVFQRLHPPSQFEGTGIGLAIVARIIHRHGGRVWAQGEVDKGTTFFFTLDTSGGGTGKPGEIMHVGATNNSTMTGTLRPSGIQ